MKEIFFFIIFLLSVFGLSFVSHSIEGENQNTTGELCQLSPDGTLPTVPVVSDTVPDKERKLKVLVLMSSSGGGHVSAANAIKGSLDEKLYDVVLKDILKGKIQGEDYFDYYFSREEWTKLSALTKIQPIAEGVVNRVHKSAILEEIQKERPDLIISTFPVANYVYNEIAHRLKIPMRIVPTDYLIDGFVNGISSNGEDAANFEIYLPANDQKMVKMLEGKGIKNYSVVGYPVRNEIEKMALQYRKKDAQLFAQLSELKKTYEVGENDKVILMSMGAKGFGQKTIEEYIETMVEEAQQITSKGGKIHVILAAGSNKELLQKMNEKAKILKDGKSSVVIHPEGWMNATQMGHRMAISHFNFIKPGGSTVGESRAFGKPMLFKADSGQALTWEKYNMDSVIEQGGGETLNFTTHNGIDKKDFIAKVKMMLEKNEEAINFPENHFSENIKVAIGKTMDAYKLRLKKEAAEVGAGVVDPVVQVPTSSGFGLGNLTGAVKSIFGGTKNRH